MTRSRAVKAWVVRWEWSGDHAAVEQPVAAVLRPQTSGDQVLRIVEILHASRQYEPDEMLFAIRRNGHQPYPAQFGTIGGVPWMGEVVCGHNPYLVARKAGVWPAGDGSGRIEWEDIPRPDL
jgi:hypothetical protein